MPPHNNRRQPLDTRLWKRSPNMDRPSTLQPRGSPGYRYIEGDSLSGRGLRTRLVVTRDRDGGNGGPGRHGDNDGGHDNNRDFHEFNGGLGFLDGGGQPHEPGRPDHGPGDSSDDASGSDHDGSDGDDSDDDSDDVPQATQPSTTIASSSGSITTLTPLVTSLPTVQPTITTTSLPAPSVAIPVQNPASGEATGQANLNSGVYPTTDRKEEGDMNTILPSSITTSTESSPTSISTPEITATTSSFGKPQAEMDGGGNNDGGKHRFHGGNKDSSRGGLDSTAEHLLIAAGAIGAFILFCFIGWIIYRVLKRTKGQGVGISGGMGFKFNKRRKGPMEGAWDSGSGTMYMANEAPPLYEKGEYGIMQSGVLYGPTKACPPGPGSIVHPVASNSETGTLRQLPNNNSLALASIIDQYPPGNENGTLRSQVPQPYYNESDLPRQPPDGYNPPQRVSNRASVLSSISSGFGDGDIIIPQPLTANNTMPVKIPDDQANNRVDNRVARESWIGREDGRRETVYTTTSEDRPARFRSITSWVNQQAGRAKRAGSRARERGEIPVMPAIPGEISTIRQTAYR
ncbi:hypothetical protein F5Y13DRAFT_28419 [Hypoxylon sp. FL1857]|nr:hypothetical protein F5Y13DRAFT_28419 [Hypoxylon sp. FL1857]